MSKIAAVVDGVLYLERAGFVTGQILHIDGGKSAEHRDPYEPSPERRRKRR